MNIHVLKLRNIFVILELCKAQYRCKTIMLGSHAIACYLQMFLRVNERGLLCVQHLIETSSKKETFLDFLMLAEQHDDDQHREQQEDYSHP